jgi:hypothetical protein
MPATINQIIKESLPLDVRAQKDTIDLISFIGNVFVDLISDIANNVCFKSKKKNIFPEHAYQALIELHLDDYFPFLLSDNQNLTLKQIIEREHESLVGITYDPSLEYDQEWRQKNG